MHITWKDIVLGVTKGLLAGFSLWIVYVLIWMFDGLLFASSSFNWIYLLTIVSVCLPIMFTLLLTLLPKRQLLLNNILKRDAWSIGAFVPAVFLSLLLLHNLSYWLDSIKYFDMGNAGGMILCLFSFIFICCMVVTDLSIVIIVAIATTKERKKKANWTCTEKY